MNQICEHETSPSPCPPCVSITYGRVRYQIQLGGKPHSRAFSSRVSKVRKYKSDCFCPIQVVYIITNYKNASVASIRSGSYQNFMRRLNQLQSRIDHQLQWTKTPTKKNGIVPVASLKRFLGERGFDFFHSKLYLHWFKYGPCKKKMRGKSAILQSRTSFQLHETYLSRS